MEQLLGASYVWNCRLEVKGSFEFNVRLKDSGGMKTRKKKGIKHLEKHIFVHFDVAVSSLYTRSQAATSKKQRTSFLTY